MSLGNQIANGLAAVSPDLGMMAGYAADKEKQERAAQIELQRDAANKSFQAALENARMQNENDHFDRSDTRQQEQFGQTLQQHKDDQKQESDYRDRALDQTDTYHQQEIGIDQARLGVEKTRAENDKVAKDDSKKAQIIGSQLTSTGRRLDNQMKLKSAELTKSLSDPMVMGDDAAQERIRAAVERKYKPILDPLQHDYESNKKRYADLTGVDFTDPSGDPSDEDDTPPNSGAPADPSDDPALVGAGMAPPPSESTTDDSPPVHGARKAPDGHWYVPDPSRPGKYLRVGS